MNYHEVIRALDRGVTASLYLLHGEERYLINHLTEKFIAFFSAKEMADFNLDILDENATPQTIVDIANTLPVMAEKRLIVVKNKYLFNATKKKKYDEKEINTLIEYIKNPNESTCLVFSLTEKADGRTKLYKALKKKGVEVKIDKLREREVAIWIEKNCERNNKKITRDALNYLLTAVGNNLGILENELQKIYSYMDSESLIDIETVKEICSKTLANNIFELVDCLTEGNTEKALFYLRDMVLAGEPEIRILFMIIRQYRLMLQAKLLSSKGHSINTIIIKTGWHPFVAKKVTKQAQAFSIEELERKLESLLELDKNIKSTGISPIFLLETGILKLAKI